MAATHEITPKRLLRLIVTPKAPAIVDVRLKEDFDADRHLVPGAIRHAHSDINGLRTRPERRYGVVICQTGCTLCQGINAWLRNDRIKAQYLHGGMDGWRTAPLHRLARVARAADTKHHSLSPEAAGLLTTSAGLSRQYRDDPEQLIAGMAIYDALCPWTHDGQGEGHDRPAERKA